VKDFNINEVVSHLVSEVTGKVYEAGVKGYQEGRAKFRSAFENYLRNLYRSVSKTKTILYKDSPVELEKIFVEPELEVYEGAIEAFDYSNLNYISNRLLVSATAGSGKSFLAKYTCLSILKNRKDVIPILLELRRLNSKGVGVVEEIKSIFSNSGLDVSLEFLRKMLSSGKFYLILDGYDELSLGLRDSVDRELLEITNNFLECPIMITTRPHERIEKWEGFYNVNVCPLDLDKAIELVQKLDYDPVVKQKFLDSLKDDLYDKHSSFLSNPLLLTIMLITYRESAEIPDKLHVFYDHAFDALFYKHDAYKDIFKREMYSGLQIDDFKSLLSIFCVLSYLEQDFTFSNTLLNDYLRQAKSLSGLSVDTSKYKEDLLKSVCILTQDGISYSFTHRSFQEYFAALYVKSCDPEYRRKLLNRFSIMGGGESVLNLYFEMDRINLEKELIVPFMKKFIEKVNAESTERGRVQVFAEHTITKLWIHRIIRSPNGEGSKKPYYFIGPSMLDGEKHVSDSLSLIFFIEMQYGALYPGCKAKTGRTVSNAAMRRTIDKFDVQFSEDHQVSLDGYSVNFKDDYLFSFFNEMGLYDNFKKRLDSLEKFYNRMLREAAMREGLLDKILGV